MTLLAISTVVALAVIAGTVYAGVRARHRTAVRRRAPLTAPPPPAPPASSLEQAVDRLADRVAIAERFDRRLQWVIGLGLGLLAVVAVIMLMGLVLVFALRSEVDQRETDRRERSIATCEQDNRTADHIDNGNNAKSSIVGAVDAVQHEIDALIAPFDAQPSSPALDDFRRRYAAGQAQVSAALDEARTAIALAHVPARDCSPAGIAASLTTTTSSGG